MEKMCEDTEQKKWQPGKDGVCLSCLWKKAELSAREVDDVKESKGNARLRRSSLFARDGEDFQSMKRRLEK